MAAIYHASPRHQLALPREHKHFTRATKTQLGEESDSGGGWGFVGSMIVRPTGWPPIWQGKTPVTQEGKQAGTDHEQNLQVLRHAPRKALFARTIKILLYRPVPCAPCARVCQCCCSSPPRRQRSSTMTARQKRALLLLGPCAASPAVVHIQEKHRRLVTCIFWNTLSAQLITK